MLNVLIVDDDVPKARQISLVLQGVPGFPRDVVSHATNVHDAKNLLSNNKYDLLILDMLLPVGALDKPTSDAGLKLLNDLLNKRRYIVPTHIVGITAYNDLMETAGVELANRMLTLLHYDATSDDWKQKLTERTRHILLAQAAQSEAANYSYDFAIICALQSPELDALLRLPWDWQQHYQSKDDTIYYRGSIRVGNRQHSVISAAALRMGMPAATSLSTKMIYEFRPRYLGMVGIAAGVYGKSKYGDILAATMTFDHGSGKFQRAQDGSLKFLPAPHQLNVSNAIGNKLKKFQAEIAIPDQIQREWYGDTIDNRLFVHTGPIASGAAVHADGTTIKDLLGRQRDLVGLDMEAYGVLVAGNDASEPRPDVIIMKSVVDYADTRKVDKYQRYAAYTSAQAMRHFAERFLFDQAS